MAARPGVSARVADHNCLLVPWDGRGAMAATTSARPGRPAGPASRGLLLTGTAVLAVTTALLVVTAVLPVSWCRAAGDALLPPLTGRRWSTSWPGRSRWPVEQAALAAVADAVLPGRPARVPAGGEQRDRRLRHGAVLGAQLGHLALVMVAPPLLVAGRPLVRALHCGRQPLAHPAEAGVRVGGDGIMVVVMMVLALGWLRRSDAAQRAMAGGWLERARGATLAAHAVRPPDPPAGASAAAPGRRPAHDLDDDDRALADCNAWLQGLARRPPD